MFEYVPITPRVAKMREDYRSTKPKIDIARYRLVTELYMENPQLTGILKRAQCLRMLFEKMPVYIHEGEIIVGGQGGSYRCSALYPEHSFSWFMQELRGAGFPNREVDPYDLDDEDARYIMETGDWWDKNCVCAMVDEHIPPVYREKYAGNGVTCFGKRMNAHGPVGHFVANFWTAAQKGFGAIRDEARAKLRELEEHGIFGDSIYKYNFYRAIETVCEGVILWSKRYAGEARRLAGLEQNSARKAELEDMAECLDWIMEHPCRNFHDAVQCIYLYQQAMCLDGQMHGISYGRVDQYLGQYYEKDLAAGRITPEYAQELIDLFFLKVSENNKCNGEGFTKSNPGYTSGQLMTLGGVDMEGRDATNPVTYMMLQTMGRLYLHTPPQALRIHEGTPDELWEAALETTKRCGGVPTFEYDGVIIPALQKRGLPIEFARNYCLSGCVEPAVGGYEWAQPGGTGTESYCNIAVALLQAINNGVNPMAGPDGSVPKQTGLPTGYLYAMENIGQVCDAYKAQVEFFMKWQASCVNAWESCASYHMPLPMVSATMAGCMESGKDVQAGGAMFNSTGNSCIGMGNVADSLNVINQVCFVQKLATTRELYDAIMNNWEGFEQLRQIINGQIPRVGNGLPECDRFMRVAADCYAQAINRATGPRGNRFCAGCYPVTANVLFGWMTTATPDGRYATEPLSDGISPVQGMDKNGPVCTMQSVLNFDQTQYGNGTLCNMKFHPTSLQGEDGNRKLRSVMEAYFEQGGMELQLNVISSQTLRDAQKHPENYRDLVVRVAGFSTYFVEVFKQSQDDLIRRTEMSL